MENFVHTLALFSLLINCCCVTFVGSLRAQEDGLIATSLSTPTSTSSSSLLVEIGKPLNNGSSTEVPQRSTHEKQSPSGHQTQAKYVSSTTASPSNESSNGVRDIDSARLFDLAPEASDSSMISTLLDEVRADDDENNLTNELCTLSVVTRRSILKNNDHQLRPEFNERALTCKRVNGSNYHQMVEGVFRRSKLNVHQIEITQSEAPIVFLAIDLVCGQFDCSKLTLLNITGLTIHEPSALSFWLNSWPKLEILDLSNTSLKRLDAILELEPPIILPSLTSLHLNFNELTELNFTLVFEHMPNLRHLSVVNNSIFDLIGNDIVKNRVRYQLDHVALAGNAINCYRSNLWLMKQFITSNKFLDIDQIKCSAPERLQEMTWHQRVSVFETRVCDECDCRSLKKAALTVDCHARNLTSLPDTLPWNTKVLNLTSNRIGSFDVFQNFRNWENVTYLYLENNLITSFQPLEINSKFMRNLVALDIRRNRFQEFPGHIFDQFINLDQVQLSDNPWLCDCEPGFIFQEWLQRQFQKVGDKDEIICGISGNELNGVRSYDLKQRLAGRVIYRLAKSDLCPQENLKEPVNWLDILNFVLALLIGIILTKITIDYVYQSRTKRLPHFFKINH